jgi:hypothetical protein
MKRAIIKPLVRRTAPPFGLMKVVEAAAIAGLNPETLRRRIRRGELAAWGSPRRVALADVMQQFEPPCLRKVVGSNENDDGTEQ